MPRKLPQRDPGAAYQRRVIASRRFPLGSRCKCGETRLEALVPSTHPLICAECDRIKRGKSSKDAHHPAGRANSRVTIPVPANDHRADLSTAQYDWPGTTLENPNGSPLLAGAASIRGFVDTNTYLTEKLILPQAEILEYLDALLNLKFGPDWWKQTELEKFKPLP